MFNEVACLDKEGTELQKCYQRRYIDILTDLQNAIKKCWAKIWFHKHFKLFSYQIKLNISTSNMITKILQKKLHIHFKWSSQRTKKVEEISFHATTLKATAMKR